MQHKAHSTKSQAASQNSQNRANTDLDGSAWETVAMNLPHDVEERLQQSQRKFRKHENA